MNAHDTVGSILEKRRAIRATLERLKNEKARTEGAAREVRNWLNGHAMSEDELARRGLAGVTTEKREELASLNTDVTVLSQRIKEAKTEAEALEAIRFPEEDQFDFARQEYQRRQVELAALRAKEKTLQQEWEGTNIALSSARSALVSAQAAKAKCLSLEDVATANKQENEAKSQISAAEVLLANLGAARARLPQEISASISAVATAESAIWSAHCALAIRDIRTLPGYDKVATMLDRAFVAWVSAGRGWDFGRFLTAVVVGEEGNAPDHEHVSSLKSTIIAELNFAAVAN